MGRKNNDVISTAYRCLLPWPISIVRGRLDKLGGGGGRDREYYIITTRPCGVPLVRAKGTRILGAAPSSSSGYFVWSTLLS